MGWKTAAGSTGRLLQLCFGYFVFYVLTGIVVKVFTGGLGRPGMPEIAYLVNNTLGGTALALLVVFTLRWVRLRSNRLVQVGPFKVPVETFYIVPSGICTAVVIPGTTLMYTLPISVMVAMVIMRGSIIVISRLVDAVQIRQGILTKRVYSEENWAVAFALLAVATNVLLLPLVGWLEGRGVPAAEALHLNPKALAGTFDFVHSSAAMTILTAYVTAYAIRIYLMNYFKNTRGPGVKLDNQGFFAIEQLAASTTMFLVAFVLILGVDRFGWHDERLMTFAQAAHHLDPVAVLSGVPFGVVAFFSVFLFMFQGRTATFAGLVNRLTSLLAGTTSTLLLAWWFGLKPPTVPDWVSFGFILVAVAFLSRAEKRRTAESSAVVAPGAGTAKVAAAAL
jgi:hypothetical protein